MKSKKTVSDEELDILEKAYANPRAKLGHDVLMLVADLRRAREQIDELRHAVEHALDCDQGTVLCKDCKRLLQHVYKAAR